MEQNVEGMKISDCKIENCETFELNKAKNKPVPKDSYTRATRTLDIVHTDILGPINPIAEDGHRFAIGFVDSFSRYLKIYLMKTRDEATEKLESFIADIGVPQTLVLDGAGEYIGQDFKRVCRKQKIRSETSAPYTPQENGKIKKGWGIITPMARCMIFDANLSKTCWLCALNMATNLKMMCFHSALGKTPYESMYGEKHNLNFVKTFGCIAYSFVEKHFRKKLDKISKRGLFLGTSKNRKAYLIGIDSEEKLKVQKSRNVSFDEPKFYFEKKIESDEGERLGDVVFFGEVLENIPKSAKEALADPDWPEARVRFIRKIKKPGN